MKATIVEKAVRNFLQSLRQRNASAHTIKAYSGDLDEFAAYVGSRGWKQIDHVTIRGFLSHLYEKGLGKTSVARALAAVRRSIAGWRRKAWSSRIRQPWSRLRNFPKNFRASRPSRK